MATSRIIWQTYYSSRAGLVPLARADAATTACITRFPRSQCGCFGVATSMENADLASLSILAVKRHRTFE